MATITSLHLVDNISEANAGSGVTISGRKTGIPPTLFGDGIRGDAVALQALSTGHWAAGDVLELGPGTYLIDQSITMACHFRPLRGAILKFAATAILTIDTTTGIFDPGWYQVFDESLATPAGGYVQFTGPNIPSFISKWWGVKGDSATDDSQTNQACWNACPDRGTVKYALGMQMKHNYLAALFGKSGVVLEADGFAGDGFFNDNTPSFNEGGVLVGKILFGMYNCGYCTIRGFFLQYSGVGIDIDGLVVATTTGSPNITIDAPGRFSTANGAAILNLLKPGSIIRTTSAPATTLLSASDGTHGVLGANATATSNPIQDGTKGGLSVGIGAPAPQQRVPTWSLVDHCKGIGIVGAAGAIGLRWSWTTGDNCDFNIAHKSLFSANGESTQVFPLFQNSGSFSRAAFNIANARHTGGIVGFSSPGGTITSGTNIFTVTNDTFTSVVGGSMEGARFRLEGAGTAGQGPNGTRGALDAPYTHVISTKSVSLWTDAGMGTPVNAQATVNLGTLGHEPHFHVGQSLGIGIQIGPSQNTHHNKIFLSQLISLGIGIDAQAGSFIADNMWSTDCELAIKVGNLQSLPSRVFNWDSEDDRQHLFLQSGQPFAEENGRHDMFFCTPSDGFYKILGALPRFRLEETTVQGQVPYDCAVFNLSQASAFTIRSDGNEYFDAFSTTEMGWTGVGMPNGATVYSRDDQFNNPDNVTLPLDADAIITSVISQANGVPVKRLGNRVYVRLPNNPVSDATLRGGEFYFFIENNVPKIRMEDLSGNFDTLGFTACDTELPTDPGSGGTFAIDVKKLVHQLVIGSTAGNRTVGALTNTPVPRFAVVQIFNGAGGAITGLTAFHSSWKLGSAWVDPAAGKSRFILFIVLSGVGYEINRSPGDVG